MRYILTRLLWFAVVASLIAFGSLYMIENFILSREGGGNKVLVRDVIKPGEHNLSGMIMVPSMCDWLAVQTSQIEAKTYMLSFKTWREPYRDCENESVPRSFKATVFGPATGINFLASLDGRPLPISVVPSVYKKPISK